MNFKDHYTFLLMKPSTNRRLSILSSRKIHEEIQRIVEDCGFQIVSSKNIHLTKTDILRLYKDDIDIAKKLSREGANKVFQAYESSLCDIKSNIILLKHPTKNAMRYMTDIKGHHFHPSKCHQHTLRYKFRNKKWDKVKLVEGGYLDSIPDDNVAHAPKTFNEFLPIVNKYFHREWVDICNQK